jgi:DNA gyrase inhibitor GyrI
MIHPNPVHIHFEAQQIVSHLLTWAMMAKDKQKRSQQSVTVCLSDPTARPTQKLRFVSAVNLPCKPLQTGVLR